MKTWSIANLGSNDKQRIGDFIRRSTLSGMDKCNLHKHKAKSMSNKGYIVEINGRWVMPLPLRESYRRYMR